MKPSANTVIICGTVIVMGCVFAVVYIANTQSPNPAALGIIGTILTGIISNLATLWRVNQVGDQAKLAVASAVEHGTEQVRETVAQAVADTQPVEDAVHRVLDAHGLPPVETETEQPPPRHGA